MTDHFSSPNGAHARKLADPSDVRRAGHALGLDSARPIIDSEPPSHEANAAQEPLEPQIELVGTDEIFKPLPATPWVVEGLQIGPGRPMLTAGYGASAKTMSMQSLALSLASGRPVWGYFKCSAQRVVHLDYEMSFAATAKRYQRLALGHGITLAELGGRLRLNPKLPSVRLSDASAKRVLIDLGHETDLVLLDSFRAALVGVDENDSKVRQYIDLLTHASQETGCSYILIVHNGKPSKEYALDGRARARGSSAIFDGAGAVLNFDRKLPPKPVCIAVSMTKPSESATGEIERFELRLEDTPGAVGGASALTGVRVTYGQASDGNGDESSSEAVAKRARNRVAVERDARALTKILLKRSGIGERELRAAVAVAGESWGRNRLDAAKACLEMGVDGWTLVNRGSERRPSFHVQRRSGGDA